MKSVLLAAALLAGTATAAHAAVTLPASFTVPNGPATGQAGYTVAFTNGSAADALNFTVSGIAYLQPGGTFGTNAAGVVVVPGNPTGVGGTLPNNGTAYGSLLATLNGTTTVQVFATNAANGLGSATPPTSLTYAGTVGSLFGTAASTLTGPGTITFTVSDSGYSDNSGSFSVVSAAAPVPEPATWGMMLVGFGMMSFGMRRRSAVRTSVRFA